MGTMYKVLLLAVLMASPAAAQVAQLITIPGPEYPQANRDPMTAVSLPKPELNLPGFAFQDLIVGPGDYILEKGVPTCKDGRTSRAGDQASLLAQAFITNSIPILAPLAKQGGALAGQFVTDLQQEVAKGTAGFLASLASQLGVSPRYATCGTFVLVAPAGYQIYGYAFRAQDQQKWLDTGLSVNCTKQEPPYLSCPLPDARFFTVLNGNVMISTFINWAREVRWVRVTIYFR
jgi:hypothetical protein